MRLKIYKTLITVFALCLMAGTVCCAQVKPAQPAQPAEPAPPAITNSGDVLSIKVDGNWIAAQMGSLKNVLASAGTEVTDALKDANIEIAIKTPSVAVKKYQSQPAAEPQQDGATFKNYSKMYPVDANDKLVIDNSYGNINVNTWNKNFIKVDVQIKASASSDNDARDMLNNVNISDAKDGSTVAFRTDINRGKSVWKTIMDAANGGDQSMSINYTVYMPSRNELVIRNRYGNIELPDLSGHVTIECSYGSIHGRSLTSESAIRERHGNIDLGNMGSTAIDLSYGNLSLGSVGKIQANASYSGININKLRESGAFNVRYGGGLKIEDMDRNVSNLAVNTSYSSVNVGLSGDENANFDITVHYGDFNYHDHNVTITDKTPEQGSHSTRSYKGYIGRNGSGKSIAINASYGSVQFD